MLYWVGAILGLALGVMIMGLCSIAILRYVLRERGLPKHPGPSRTRAVQDRAGCA